LLQVNDEIKKIISQKNFSLDELSKEARKAGMRTMFEDGLQKVELAQTTLEEVLRVIME
jgi:type IV pilus assembly protein PilB